ncbi:MBL fold metallo-hydrolase [Pseudokineococcus sp. 5B2Z-1]|uniref:MBL fold metallo-hydrolase n=1 Tax=Pseudokineococcus sp. 5B2Z-1 TaxID=3132744 RepID=UPI00309BAA08
MSGAADEAADDVVGAAAHRVLAPNPGPMTLEGTNTWVLGLGGGAVVVDPGPDDEGHLRRVLEVADRLGGTRLVVLTHHHDDHRAGAPRLAALAGAPLRAADADLQGGAARGTPGLGDGDALDLPGARLAVVAAPGHTGDSVGLLLEGPGEGALLLTGDTVLGRGTSVVAHPDGDLAAYLATLGRLAALVDDRGVVALLPGHGPVVDRPGEVVAALAAHRRARLEEVRDAVRAGARTPAEVVARVYPDLDAALRPAATRSSAAALALLAHEPVGGGAP